MRYTIKCSECEKTFVAESQIYGKVKYRCPYCGYVMTCLLDAPQDFVVRARAILPVTDNALVCGRDGKRLQLVMTEVVNRPSQSGDAVLREGTAPVANTGIYVFLRRLWRAVVWTWVHFAVFFSWSSGHIGRFREKYEDADLWLFFGFSLLFLVFVVLGLFVFAEFTKLIVSGQSWLFRIYLQIIH